MKVIDCRDKFIIDGEEHIENVKFSEDGELSIPFNSPCVIMIDLTDDNGNEYIANVGDILKFAENFILEIMGFNPRVPCYECKRIAST